MNKRACRTLSILLSLSLSLAAFADEVDWPYYGADQGGTRYTPSDQINRDNFDQLRVVWRYRPRDQQISETARASRGRDRGQGGRRRGGFRLGFDNNRGTPVAINGVLYYGSPYNILSAIDGQSGEELWAFDPESWQASSMFLGNSRGVSYWTDGEVERVFLATSTAHLYSIDAKTGLPDSTFGEGGRVDLGALLRRPLSERERRGYGVTAPPVVCRGVVAVGSAIMDVRGRPPAEYIPPGDVQAFDARSGEKVWEFHTIPQEGEYGNETWGYAAWKTYGAANVWATMTADEELGNLYLPVSTASHDYYGGERPGDNLFSESVVCLKGRDWRAGVALPASPPRPVGLRPAGRAPAVGRGRRWPRAQDRRPAYETGLLLCLRPRNWRADLANRRKAGAPIASSQAKRPRRRSLFRPNQRPSSAKASVKTT